MTTLLDWSARTDMIELLPVLARTAGGNSAAFDVRAYTGRAMVLFYSDAPTGTTPSMTAIRIMDSADGSTGWAILATEPTANVTFTPLTTLGTLQRRWFDIGATRGFIRFSWAMGGTTPSYSFGATLLARQT